MSANDDTYTYDSRGNITSKTVGDTVTSFTYANTGWKDLLVSVDDTELEYDANGNVILYGDREFTWNTGRNLESVVDENNRYSYTYDENGIRTSKTVDGVTTYYNTKDGVILSQTDGENTWYFQYDTSGTPLGFVLNGTQYFYITNQMNDVLAITDTEGNIIGNYEYDAWGKVLTANTNIAKQNPIRYRGYYYDNETGYYYLQSRYYDSNICRFINADNADVAKDFKNIYNGTNIYIYCLNNATNSFDVNGHVTVNLKNKKISNVIVKFARRLMSSWNVTSSVNSKKYILKSVYGVTLYIGASASTSLNAMRNNVSAGNGNVKVSNKCSLSYKKAKLSYSTATTYKNNTLKAVVTLGTTAITYGLSLITKYFYTSRASCYYSIDLGLRISHWITATATVVVAGICVAAPYIAPAVGKIYTSVLSSISSYKAFVRALTAIASAGMTVATKLA